MLFRKVLRCANGKLIEAAHMLGVIRRNVVYQLICPYKTIVLPYIEYYLQACRQYCKTDTDMLDIIHTITVDDIIIRPHNAVVMPYLEKYSQA